MKITRRFFLGALAGLGLIKVAPHQEVSPDNIDPRRVTSDDSGHYRGVKWSPREINEMQARRSEALQVNRLSPITKMGFIG